MSRFEEEFQELPEGLKGELRGMYRPTGGGGMGEGKDRETLAAARGFLPTGRKPEIGWGRRLIEWGVAAAAIILITAMLLPSLGRAKSSARRVQVAAEAARRGYVKTGDIRDAFYLARQLEAKRRLTSVAEAAAWDANHDGRVDQQDVQALAMGAVALEKNGGLR